MSIPVAWKRAGTGAPVATDRNPSGAGISEAGPLAGSVDSTQAGRVKVPLSASPATQVNWAPIFAAGFWELPIMATDPAPLQVMVKSWERGILPMASCPVQEARSLG